MAAFRLPRLPLVLLTALLPATTRADGAMPLSLGDAFATAMEAGPLAGSTQPPPAALETVLSATEVWGTVNPSSITLRPRPPLAAGGDHVADVLFDNHLTVGNVDIKSVSLRIDGLVVHVTIVHGMDRIPDALQVDAPLGYVATPPSVLVDDGAVGVIQIHRVPVS